MNFLQPDIPQGRAERAVRPWPLSCICVSRQAPRLAPGSPSCRHLSRSSQRPFGLPFRRWHDQLICRTFLRRALGKFAGEPPDSLYANAASVGPAAASSETALGSPKAQVRSAEGVTGGGRQPDLLPQMLRRRAPRRQPVAFDLVI